LRHGKYAIKALPPGVVSREFALSEKKGKLKLLYVGGCKPPYYDITNLFRCNNVLVSDIIIVTRENEWNLNKNFYNSLSNKVIVKHLSGEKLDMLYAEVDIFIDLREAWGNDYFKSSMPLKFFEALGFGKPIILMKGSVVADLIQEYKLGFVLNNIDELDSALSFVRENYTNIQGNILRFNSFNTWDSRAEQIINDLKCI
jgi:glycosyltransferase involved in cell wall biosynthesis